MRIVAFGAAAYKINRVIRHWLMMRFVAWYLGSAPNYEHDAPVSMGDLIHCTFSLEENKGR